MKSLVKKSKKEKKAKNSVQKVAQCCAKISKVIVGCHD